MSSQDYIHTTSEAIESVDIELFLQRMYAWRDSMRGDHRGEVVANVLDTVLDEFFDCCEFMRL